MYIYRVNPSVEHFTEEGKGVRVRGKGALFA